MAAVAVSPQIVRDGRLQYGGLDVQLPVGTSFWARTDQGNETSIHVSLHSHENYHTTFALVLPTQEAYHDAIRDLLAANINANRTFYVDRISIIDAENDSPAEIHLRFPQFSGIDNFVTHGKEICNDHGFDVDQINGEVILTARNNTSLTEQADKINQLFKAIIGRLGDGNISEELEKTKDRRFPGKEREMGGQCMSAIDCTDLQRNYELSQGELQEVIHLGSKTKIPVSPEEINAWLENPKSFKGRQVEKYLHFVFGEMANAPLDLNKLRRLIPGFLLEDDRFDVAYKQFLTRAIKRIGEERPIDAGKMAEFVAEAGKMKMDVADLLYPKSS